jgi:serine phosphatase RsbU (regulator of sigma subunit)
MREADATRILETLNESLYREGVEESFCTAVYATIELDEHRVTVELTSAGHPLPLVLRADGSVETGARPGTLLGAVPELTLEPRRIVLDEGDALVIFTDGVVEARSDEGVFGEQRLRRTLEGLAGATAGSVADRIESEAVAFQAGEPADDLAVLVVRRATGAERVLDDQLGTREPATS